MRASKYPPSSGPDRSWTASAYDTAGNKVRTATPGDAGDAISREVYDLGGRVVASISAEGIDTQTRYDRLGRSTGSGGGVTGSESGATTAYNNAGWVTRKAEADGVVTSSTYDAAGRVLISETGGKATVTAYDEAGRAVRTANPDGTIVAHTYDAFGRDVLEQHSRGGAEPFKEIQHLYDAVGRETTTTDLHTGLARTMAYAESQAGSSVTTLTVPLAGASLASASRFAADGSQGLTTLAFSVGGVLALSATRSVDATDSAGRVTRTTLASSSASTATTWVFDALGRMASYRSAGLTATATVSFNTAGRKSFESWPLTTTLGGQWQSSYTYLADGRLSAVGTKPSGGTTATTTYAFDPSGAISKITAASQVTTFAYADNRVVGRQVGGSRVATYIWDTAHGWRTGRLEGGVSTAYAYDGAGHLTTVSVGATTVAAFAYDGAGQRTSSVMTTAGVTTQAGYLYEGITLHALSATASPVGSSSVSATYTIAYAYAPDGRPYAGVYSASDDTGSPRLFTLVTTDRGDVVALTDASGSAFATYRYDAWGNPTASFSASTGSIPATLAAAIATRQPLRYAGYAWDATTGLYYCSQRHYDPVTAAFLTRDPARADGEESAYQYCGGDPVGKVDPSGKQSLWAWFTSVRLDTVYRFYRRAGGFIAGIGTSLQAWEFVQKIGQFWIMVQATVDWSKRALKIWSVYKTKWPATLRMYLGFQTGDDSWAGRVGLGNVATNTKIWTVRNFVSEYHKYVVNTARDLVIRGVSIAW